MLHLLQLVLVTAVDIGVRGSGTCPSSAAIVREAQPLLPGRHVEVLSDDAPPRVASETVELSSTPEGRSLILRDSRGEVVRREKLSDRATCDEAARESAVMLAAWEFQGEATPPPAARPSPTKPSAPSAPPALPPTTVAVATDRPAPASAPLPLSVGTAFVAGFVGERPSWGILGELHLGPPEGLGLRLEGVALSEASLAVGNGRALWSRAWLGVGGLFSLRRGAWGLDVHGEALGGVYTISGDGFSSNQRGRQVAFGAAAGLRASWGRGLARVWLGPTLVTWPGQHTVTLAGTTVSRDLPSYEAIVALGVDFLVRP